MKKRETNNAGKEYKVFLVEPPISVREYEIDNETKYTIWLPPLWAISIGTFFRKKTPRTHLKILDGQLLSFSNIKKQIIKEKPDFVGISPKHKTYQRALRLARISKQTGAKVILGGLYADSLAKEIIKNRGPRSSDYCVDLVVKGDGERAFLGYCEGQPLKQINNLVYQGEHEIKENPIDFPDLNNLPVLNFNLVNPNNYFQDYQKRYPSLKRRTMLRIYTQKGCAWRRANKRGCIYCSFSGGPIRLKSPRIIWREINNVIEEYNVNKIMDISDMAFEDKKWFSEFYRLALKNKNPLPSFNTIVKVGSLNNLMIKKMKQININHVTFKFANKLSKFRQVDGIVASQFMPYPNTYAWKMLLSKVGDKYADTDNPDFRQIQLDWQSHFCAVGDKNLGKAANIINQLR